MTTKISVILPMFNEEDVVEKAITVVSERLSQTEMEYEIICVNDGSADNTGDVIDSIAARDERVVAVHFSRNFGKESGLAAGLEVSSGDAVITLDADLQHPPSLIPEMIALWKEGYDVVEGRKAQRGRESVVYRSLAKLFYGFMGKSAGNHLRNSSDFKLLDRQVVDTLCQLPEKSRFFRGLVSWVGYKHKVIEFDVAERAAGKTAWSLGGLIRYAVNNLLAFSTLPLYLTAWVGLSVTCLGVGLGVQTLYNYLSGNAVSGFTTVILLVLIFSGIILISIGIVAIYLAKVLEEVKGRPLYVVRKNPPVGSRGNGAH